MAPHRKSPSTLSILADIYEVEENSPNLTSYSDALGLCDNCNLKILIEKSLHPDVKEGILLHEIIEAINYQLQLGLPHSSIQSLATSLITVFRSNRHWKFF